MESFPPKIRGTQIGLKQPRLVDEIKSAMRADAFRFGELQARIGGVRDAKGVYHIVDGHHRVVAALELWSESRDSSPLRKLLEFGRWDEVDHAPRESRPLP